MGYWVWFYLILTGATGSGLGYTLGRLFGFNREDTVVLTVMCTLAVPVLGAIGFAILYYLLGMLAPV